MQRVGPVMSARAPVSDKLAERLVTAICVGAYSPGERLPPEREFAVALGVSRETLRQALGQVAALGLVESRRGRGGGTYVTTARWEDIAPEVARRTLEEELPALTELSEYRCLIEGLIAREAAIHMTDRERDALVDVMEQFDHADSMITARRVDRQLHRSIATGAGNAHLAGVSVELTAQMTLGFGAEPYPEEQYERARAEHRELVELVVAGDADAADRSARAHFHLTLDIMVANLERAVAATRSVAEGKLELRMNS